MPGVELILERCGQCVIHGEYSVSDTGELPGRMQDTATLYKTRDQPAMESC